MSTENENTNNPNLTPEQQQELQQLREALLSEFHIAEASGKGASAKSALTDIEELKPDFLSTLKYIVNHSQKDELRAKVAMWGYDKLLEEGKTDSDPLKKLLEGMEAARATAA